MALSLRRRLLDRVLPAPEGAAPDDLARLLRHGSSGVRIRALREAAVQGDGPPPQLAAALLSDPVPGVRRAAAWALGRSAPSQEALEVLWRAARTERCDAPRLAMAVAAVRHGAEVGRAWELLHDAAERSMVGFNGPRRTGHAAGAGIDVIAPRWVRALDPLDRGASTPESVRPRSSDEVRAALHDRLDRDPEDRDALAGLAELQHPADFDRLVARKWVSGRRESHAICEALGVHGDPRAVPTLVRVLQAMDVDPGHGFAGRRLAATALGRIGDPDVGLVLVKALDDEARDHEGRPGAGMGIQFPVRTVMVTALGEAGCVDQVGLVVRYLADTSGSALGGFYLQAMDAAWKLGRSQPLLAALDGDALTAANALGVLAAMGEVEAVRSRLGDPRPEVAATAAAALAACR